MVFYLYHCVRYTFAIYSQLYSYIQRRFLWHKRQSWVCTDDMILPRFIYGIFHTWSYRGRRVPLAAWTGINFVVSWDRAVNAWNQCESLHRTAHVLILQLKGWIPYILGLMYVDLNLKTNSNHYGDIVCIQSWFWFEINFSSFSSKWSQWYRSKLGLYLISYVYRNWGTTVNLRVQPVQ